MEQSNLGLMVVAAFLGDKQEEAARFLDEVYPCNAATQKWVDETQYGTGGSNKDNLESCISVYNHAFVFPLSVAIPATKRGNGGGGGKHEA
ncbi:hypothetical protein LXL04_022118 [Taraxacum kok-saghyz]